MSTPRPSSRRAPKLSDSSGKWAPGTERISTGAPAIPGIAIRYGAAVFHRIIAWAAICSINDVRDPGSRSAVPPGYPLGADSFRLLIPDPVFSAQYAADLFGWLVVLPPHVVARCLKFTVLFFGGLIGLVRHRNMLLTGIMMFSSCRASAGTRFLCPCCLVHHFRQDYALLALRHIAKPQFFYLDVLVSTAE